MSQSGTFGTGGSGGSGITTINGDTGSITGSTVTIYADNAAKNCGSSVLFVNSGTVSTFNVTDGMQNTLIGQDCGNASIATNATQNHCLGYGNMSAITSGSYNIALGGQTLSSCTSGSFNMAIGTTSMFELIDGSNNVGVGFRTLYNSGQGITSGSNNTAIGSFAGSLYQGAESSNICIGSNTTGITGESNAIRIGQSNTTGIQLTNANSSLLHNFGTSNIFLGQNAGNFTLTTADATQNVAVGYNAMPAVTSGSQNTAIGAYALYSYTGSSGDGNVVIGDAALSTATTIFGSTIIGSGAAEQVTSSYNLTAIGEGALNNLLTGDSNIAIGQTAGSNYTGAESSNIIIGVGVGTIGDNNTIRIGLQGSGDAEQNRCFVAGIIDVTVPNASASVVVDTVTGQLGVTALPITVSWSIITANQTAAVNNGYFCNKAGTLALALPATSNVGDVIEASNINTATGTQFTQAAGQEIFIGNTHTTIGATGTLTSSSVGDSLKMVCRVANTTWNVISMIGNWTPV